MMTARPRPPEQDNEEEAFTTNTLVSVVVKHSILLPQRHLKTANGNMKRVFPILQLPGQVDSGIPKFLLPEDSAAEPDPAETCLRWFMSIVCSLMLILLVNLPFFVMQQEHLEGRTVLIVALVIMVLGLLLASGVEAGQRALIPGKAVERQCVRVPPPPSSTTTGRAQPSSNDDGGGGVHGRIGLVEAADILRNHQHNHQHNHHVEQQEQATMHEEPARRPSLVCAND